ncbi:4Fe-4S dicluster domain-containing protein [Clostridium thermarum]|uniref:4Fe-4S dicluster domain-containing protein n=1 Tax=Clostridium thermarum TaxID=1716543 RepID=UPI0013D7C3A0|nr:4Fe-4S dicluster domain-containing protein [Clostridium thermarum]
MSKTWYPVINYESCIECGACTNKCKNGVYDLEKAPTPVVIYPEGCVQGCHGCSKLCSTASIEYVGEQRVGEESCGCSCGVSEEGCC